MCGIAGIIQADPSKSDLQRLNKMTTALAHRGPDGEGLWHNEANTTMLGHRRLSILDLSDAGSQPMHYMGRYTIIHNGEIYNYIELKEELRTKGYSFHSQTDTEVIVAAYDCWKEDCVQHFDGMFAFAIWDEKATELFAARDRFGEKPFFYYPGEKEFLFASEMKALWAAGIPRSPNRKLLFNFITIGYTDNPAKPEETFYDNILKLPPASWLKFSGIYFTLATKKYWDVDPEATPQKISDEEALTRFDDLLRQSVKKRLRSDVSLGTSLSGGIDSSAIAALCHSLHSPVNSHKCFTAVFPGFEKDEAALSKITAAQFGLQQYTTTIGATDLLNSWEKICHHQEEPFGSASIFAQYKVYELAAEQDVTVLLDGQGADEILGGYHKYYKWYWQELFRNRKLKKSGEIAAARQLGIAEPFTYKNMIAAYFPGFASVVMERQYLLQAIRQEDLAKEFVKEHSKEAYYTPPEHFNLNGVLYFNTCIHGLEELLRYADRNSMAHGREVRLPFLSHELVEFMFSLPSHFKIRQGWTKWLLRQNMKKMLPEAIVYRKDKVGFEPPQKNWMETDSVKEAIHEARKILVEEKILKPETLNKPVTPRSSHEAGNYDWRYLSSSFLFK